MAGSGLLAVELLVAASTGAPVIVGELSTLVRRGLAASGDATVPAVPITGDIAFGPVLDPHIVFGGGAAAAGYAARRGYLEPDPGFPYHPAKRITEGLGTRLNVLALVGVLPDAAWVLTP